MQGELRTRIISISDLNKFMFVDFLSMDRDYSENEEYFREDTIELGYENEAERISEEMYNRLIDEYNENPNYSEEERLKCIEDILEELANDSTLDSTFILGNESYTWQYDITVVCNDYEYLFDDNISVFVAWFTNS